MDLSFTFKTQASTSTLEPLSVALLFERGEEYVQQERYAEGIALLTLACEHLTTDHGMHPTTLLDTLMQECAKYSQLQQALEEVSAQLIVTRTKLQASLANLSALQSTLLNKQNGGHVHHSLEQAPADVATKLTLYAICLGPFEVRRLGVPIALPPNRNSQAILRYQIAQPNHSATADTLMALLWSEDPEEVAIRKLRVTVSILRRSLQNGCDRQDGYILYKQGTYQLNPSIPLHTDVEEFLVLYNAGRKAGKEATVSYYERACSLYTRPFLIEDLYADWSYIQREQLRQIHREMCSTLTSHYLEIRSFEKAVQWASAIIEENRCDEAAYCQLMRIYALQGRRHDALREYQRCQQVLLEDLGVGPVPETVNLYQAIVRGELNQ